MGVSGRPGRLVLTAGGALLVLFACFPHRLDYAAHVVAGIGVAGLLAVLGDLRGRPGSDAVAPARLVVRCVGGVAVAAVLAEFTVTGPPDLLDMVNTVMGGLLGTAAVLVASPEVGRGGQATPGERGTGLGEGAWVGVVGAVAVLVAIVVRYPVQKVVKHWWWFGS